MAAVTGKDASHPSLTVMDAARSSLKVNCVLHSSQLVSGLVALWKAGELCDYVIKGTDESFSIHSPVLAVLSPVFKAMLTSDMKESAKRDGACTFPEIPDAIMKKLLEVAYTGTCSVAREELAPLIAAAHYLGMTTLLEACEKLIPALLCPSNCFSWARIAKTFELDALVPRIQTLMRTSHEQVIQSGEFSEAEGTEVSKYLRDLVQHGIHSDMVLAAALQWIERDPESRAVHMSQLFLSASVADCTRPFLKHVMREKSDIIELHQNYVMHKLILEQILDKDSEPPLLILGGQDCGFKPPVNNDCWILKDDHLVKFAAGPGAELKPKHSICQVPQGVMVTGGHGSTMCKLLDVVKKTWVDKASLLTARSHHGSGYLNGNVFVCAGQIGVRLHSFARKGTVHYLDVAENTWQHGPDLPVSSKDPKVAVCNSKLYVLISYDGTLYCLDWANKAWTEKSGLRTGSIVGCSMATVDDRMFVAGGIGNVNYMYTPETDSWCRLTGPTLKNDRFGSLVYHRKKLYLIAGCEFNAELTDVMEYDIGADTWAMSPWKLPKPLRYHAAFGVDVSL